MQKSPHLITSSTKDHPFKLNDIGMCVSEPDLTLNYRERIEQLEQALEQSLAVIGELKLQLKDQHLLEAQLAATEETANLQQQAINELQRQLTQPQSLAVEIAAKHPALPERIRFPPKHQPLQVDLPVFLTKRQRHGRR